MLAGIAEGHFGLAFVDTLTRSIAIAVAIAAYMSGAIGKTAALAARVHIVRAIVPAAKILFEVATCCFFSSLHFGRLRGLGLQLVSIFRAAEPAHGGFDIAMHAAEVTATYYALGRRSSETYSDWAFTS